MSECLHAAHRRGNLALFMAVLFLYGAAPGVAQWTFDPAVNAPVATAPGIQSRSDIISDGSLGSPLPFQRVDSGTLVEDGGYSYGCSWGDIDNDGRLDLFVANRNTLDNVYRNSDGEQFTKIDMPDIVYSPSASSSGTWGDYDNDGDLDLFVANGGQNNFLYSNDGDGTFTEIDGINVVTDGGSSRGCSWVDYNNDGFLDLLVVNTLDKFLYTNNGDATFSTITTGDIISDNSDFSNGCSWADFNDDGFADLFVANNGKNYLYVNNKDSTFTKVTSGAVVADNIWSNGGSWGDYDNDGDLDLFVTNYSDDKNNALYRNDGGGVFAHVTTVDVSKDGKTSRGSSWGDFDNDGDLDLFVANKDGESVLYSNVGDGTFLAVDTADLFAADGDPFGTSWCDVNRDGFLDLFVANYNQNNSLYLNNANSNHWLQIRCIGTVSNRSAIGTRVWIKAVVAGQPVWQMREISAQTGYYSQNSLDVEFGLADAVIIDSLRIEWPSGMKQEWANIDINRFLVVYEGSEDVPVDLEAFAVRLIDGQVQLEWSTVSVHNCYGFEIERRIQKGGGRWQPIGFVPVREDGERFVDYVYLDGSAAMGTALEYRLKIVDRNGLFSFSKSVSLFSAAPRGYALYQNYPNPFNDDTRILYYVPENCRVELELYDIRGRLVRKWTRQTAEPGEYGERFSAGEMPTGVYFTRMSTERYTCTIKMLLIR